jgi:hypothetical protein
MLTDIYLSLNIIPFSCIKIFQGPIIFSSNINIDVRDIYLSLNVIRVITLQAVLFTKGQES